jgi:hypothetical protein
MDQAVTDALAAAAARGVLAQTEDAAQAMARQRDGAAFDMRALGGAIARELVQADDPQTIAGLNTTSHVPTPQPYVAPNFVSPQGGPPATAPK